MQSHLFQHAHGESSSHRVKRQAALQCNSRADRRRYVQGHRLQTVLASDAFTPSGGSQGTGFTGTTKLFTRSTSVQLARNFKTSAQQSPAEQSSSFSTTNMKETTLLVGGNCEATDQQQVLNTVKQQAVHQHLRYQQTRRKNHWSCWHQPSQSQQQTEQSHVQHFQEETQQRPSKQDLNAPAIVQCERRQEKLPSFHRHHHLMKFT